MPEEKAFSGKLTIDSALQLIRYDIPVMILGKSSIGKSYTLIDITKKWNISNSLLYIGSEKSENIEGVPKLTQRQEDKEILEYLQPYWFPNASVITQSVKNGRKLFDDFVKDYWSDGTFKYGYRDIHSLLDGLSYVKWNNDDLDKHGAYTKKVKIVDKDWEAKPRELNSKPFELRKDPVLVRKEGGIESEEVIKDEYKRDDLKDFCAYLTTCLGYGNYWLILDEIDKVEEYDRDKFAPLLHIVRERTLKNFKMIDINNGEGLNIPFSVKEGGEGYKDIVGMVNANLDSSQSVLDTRVMAIANNTKEIEEALFRRFIQLVAQEVMIWRKGDLSQRQDKIESCLSDINSDMVNKGLDEGSLIINPGKIQTIPEINLQWKYNFLPKVLNVNDIQANLFISNLKVKYAESKSKPDDGTGFGAWFEDKKFTALYNMFSDNFSTLETEDGEFVIAGEMFECLTERFLEDANIGEGVRTAKQQAEGMRGEIEELMETLGDNALVAEDISDKLRESYQQYVVDTSNEETRLQGLHSWTDEIVAYLNAIMYSPDGAVVPLDVYKHLIPALVNVFYTEMAVDQNNQADNVVAVTVKFQAFFTKLYTDEDAIVLHADKDATQKAFWGATKSELKDMTDEERMDVSLQSLFGASEYQFDDSARSGIGKINIRSSLPLLLQGLISSGDKGMVLKFQSGGEYYGITRYLKKYFKEDLEDMSAEFKNQAKTQAAAGNKPASEKATKLFSLIGILFLK